MGKLVLDLKEKKKVASVFVTLIIVLTLVFSGPAGAVRVGVDVEKTEYSSSDEFVNFTVWVDIESAERIPIQNLTLNITGPTNESCIFYPDGTEISGCDNVTISSLSVAGYGYGSRYGYDWNDGYGYTFGTGYGYGYGSVTGYTGNTSAELRYNVTWNLTAASVSDGDYNATLYAYASGGETDHIYSSNNVTQFTIDLTAPTIYDFEVTNIKHNAATINWKTNENTTGKIEYGKTTSYGTEVTINNPVKIHHRRITGLDAETTYHYRIRANDSLGNSNVSSDKTFTTDESPGKSGSAGGGGGGGGAPPASKNNVPVNNAGKVTSTTTITSSDGSAKLTIPQATTALDAEGKALKSITISPISIGGTIAAFNLGPEGARFNPPIRFSITYDQWDVPEGSTVVIKMFDGSRWISLETTVDTVAKTATAKISHFTYFALFVVEAEPVRPIATPLIATITATPVPTVITPTPTPPAWGWVSIVILVIAVLATYLMYARWYKRGRR
ncbi:MAG: fibronectin type III domain-containing protein [Halobacteriota archaeon]|nr:fibronectin type III domain-containing protein [Halobacteriota archaeon]